VLVLPIPFLGGSGVGISGVDGVTGCTGGVGGSVNCVTGNMGSCSGVTGGTGSGTGCILIGAAGSGVGGKCSGARLAHRNLATYPCTPCFDSFPRPVVFRVLLLEIWKHMPGTVSSPYRQCSVIPLAQKFRYRLIHACNCKFCFSHLILLIID
jgi:hypothetical protein